VWDGEHLGGVVYNIPFNFYVLSVAYSSPEYCTTDTLYIIPPNVSCQNCVPHTNSLHENQASIFSLYPNPSNDIIQLVFNNKQEKEVAIYDLKGNVHYSTTTLSDQLEIRTSKLNRGVYIVEVRSAGTVLRKKLIKN